MSDLISRQAAIDLLKQMRKDGDMIPWEGKDVFARIRKLPSVRPDLAQLLAYECGKASAQPERGEWIMTKELDEDVATCPFCGAEMRKAKFDEKKGQT